MSEKGVIATHAALRAEAVRRGWRGSDGEEESKTAHREGGPANQDGKEDRLSCGRDLTAPVSMGLSLVFL